MLRRILLAFLSAFVLVLAFSHQSQASSAKSYSADQFNVSAKIASGGTMDVTENVTFHFTGGPFTFVSRQLPTDNIDSVSVVSASIDNQTMSEGSTPGQYEVDSSNNPISVTWHFSPTSDASHTFTLNYHMEGIIQKSSTDATDLLDWMPLPTSHDYSISSSVVTITYPSSAALVSAPKVAQGTAIVSQSAGQVQFQSTDLAANAYLEIGLRFRSGSLISTAPNWQQTQQQAKAVLPYALAGGIVIFIVGSFLFIRYYRKYRRRASASVLASLQITEPPADLPPAIAGVLATTTDGSPTWDHALGTLLDLINREIVTVIPPLQGGWGAWSNGRPDFQLALVDLPNDLRLHEAGLLKMLFRTEGGIHQTVKISQVGQMYNSQSKFFREPLKQEMTALGFFEPWRQRARHRLGCTTSLMFLLSLIAIFFLCGLSWPMIFLGLGITGISITTFFLWAMFSTYTDAAAEAKAQWEAFLQSMRSLASMDQPSIGPQLFAQYLPYSASFSLLIPWAKTLQRQGMLALPNWFKRLVTAGNQNYSNDPTHAFLVMIETTHELTHKSESNSGSGASHVSGSSGAAGGGSSGAG